MSARGESSPKEPLGAGDSCKKKTTCSRGLKKQIRYISFRARVIGKEKL